MPTNSAYDFQLHVTPIGGTLTTTGYTLAIDPETGQKSWNEGLAPDMAQQQRTSAFGYEHRPPQLDVPVSFEDFSLGAGFEYVPMEMRALDFGGYNYSKGVDASWGNKAYLAPAEITRDTLDDSGVTNPLKIIYDPTLGTYALTKYYVYTWDGTVWKLIGNAGTINSWTDMTFWEGKDDIQLIVSRAHGPPYIGEPGAPDQDGGIIETLHEIGGGASDYANGSFRAVSAIASGASATTVTVTKPTGTAEDDILIAWIGTENTSAVSCSETGNPEGWHNFAMSEDANGTLFGLWRRAGSAEGSDYTFQILGGSAADIMGVMSAYQNIVTTGNPIEYDSTNTAFSGGPGFTANQTTTGTTHATATVYSSNYNRKALVCYYFPAAVTSTQDGSITERFDGTANGSALSGGDNNTSTLSPGQTGSYTVTSSSSTTSNNIAVLLRSNKTAGPPDEVYRVQTTSTSSGSPLLWAMDINSTVRNNPDPTVSTTWSAADTIQFGRVKTINGWTNINGVIYATFDTEIVKYDGTTVTTIFEDSSFIFNAKNARPYTWSGDGNMYFAVQQNLYQYNADDNVITRIWPHKWAVGNKELSGIIQSIAGDAENLYFYLRGDGGTDGYIMKGDPRSPRTIGTEVMYPFHTLKQVGNSDCQAMLIQEPDPASKLRALDSNNFQIVYGKGTAIHSIDKTQNGELPDDTIQYGMDTTGSIWGSYTDMNILAFPKFLSRVSVQMDLKTADSSGEGCNVDYDTLQGAAVEAITNNQISGRKSVDITANVEFDRVRYVVDLFSNLSTQTPELQGVVLHAVPVPPRKRLWRPRIIVADGLELRNGARDPQSAKSMIDNLFAAPNAYTQMTIDGTVYVVRVLDIQSVGEIPHKSGDKENNIKMYDLVIAEIAAV